MAAIAAVLVFATAPAGALQVPDVPADPPVVQPEPAAPTPEPAPAPEASAAAPALPQPSSATEVVQPVPAQPAEAAQATPVTRAPRPAAPARAAVTAPTPAPQSVRRDVLAEPLAPPAAVPAAQPGVVLATPAAPAPQPSPAVAATDTHVDEAAWWALGTGTLLFAGGLGALALGRSRKRTGPARVDQAKDRAPAATTQPAMAAEAAIAVPEPIMVAATAPAPRAATAANSGWSQLEQMVAEAPSAENPFLTHRKRMRRARYLLEHGLPQPLSPEVQRNAEPAREAGPRPQPQPTFSFGRASAPGYPNWKPATT